MHKLRMATQSYTSLSNCTLSTGLTICHFLKCFSTMTLLLMREQLPSACIIRWGEHRCFCVALTQEGTEYVKILTKLMFEEETFAQDNDGKGF